MLFKTMMIFSLQECQSPPITSHASHFIDIDPDTDGRYPVGTILTIRCGDLYYQSGPTNRTCQVDGTWSDKRPSCNECNAANIIKLILIHLQLLTIY